MGIRSWFAGSTPATATATSSATATATTTKSKKGLLIDVMNSSPNSQGSGPLPRSPPRNRLNSREISRTYSGLYSQDDLTPLAVQQQSIFSQSVLFFFVSYMTLILAIQLLVTDKVFAQEYSWTVTHALHLVVTLAHVHWLKGSISDTQGELNAMTVWEQLAARGQDAEDARRVLRIVPTGLCYAACHFSEYDWRISLVNILLWCIAMLAKLEFMNGKRIFGINRTPGIDDIDDDAFNDDEQTDETPDMAAAEFKKQN